MTEIWKEIETAKSYAVSNLGRVKRLARKQWCVPNKSFSNKPERLLTICYNNSKKYARILIVNADETKTYSSVHRLVAQAFIPNPLNLPQVNHKNGMKADNTVENLEWCTGHENMRHRISVLGVESWAKGEKCNFCVLTEEKVRSIPGLLKEGHTKRAIAKLLNVAATTITEITSGRSWKHLGLYKEKVKI